MLILFALALAAAPAPAVEAEIKAASATFDRAQFEKDKATLDRMLARDFRFVRGSGKFTGRDDFIAGFTDPEVTFEPFVIADPMYVALGPDAGIVGGKGTIRGTEKGKPFEEHFRYADTFHRINGHWRVVYVQVTPIK